MNVIATKLEVNLPFGIGKLTLEPDEVQQKAAWELYVELATRISVSRVVGDKGSIRDALSSLYSIVNTTREILRKAGPSVATGPNSFGPIAIKVINQGIRPFLDTWHAELLHYEQSRPPESNPIDYEHHWEKYDNFWDELAGFQEEMMEYITALAFIADIVS
jgi:hypothetical protein